MYNDETAVRATNDPDLESIEELAISLARMAQMHGGVEIKSINLTFAAHGVRLTATTKQTRWFSKDRTRVF